MDSVLIKTNGGRSDVYFSEVARQPVFKAMYLSKDNILFAAESSTYHLLNIAIEYDG